MDHGETAPHQPGKPPSMPASTEAPMAVQLTQSAVARPAKHPPAPGKTETTSPMPNLISPDVPQVPEAGSRARPPGKARTGNGGQSREPGLAQVWQQPHHHPSCATPTPGSARALGPVRASWRGCRPWGRECHGDSGAEPGGGVYLCMISWQLLL